MLLNFPLLVLVALAYNLIVFSGAVALDGPVYALAMVSGGVWVMTVADVLLAAALALLCLEILKATRISTGSIVDRMLSTLVFIGCLIEFLLVRQAATSTFFLITMIALVDVVAGYSVTSRTARRDFAFGPDSGAI